MEDELINPWKTVSTRHIYQNPWISVREDQVITPTGSNGIYGVVTFANKAYGIVPLDENNNTWLVGQYRYSLNEYSWEIPMGGGPVGQDQLESAKRELQEETGFSAAKWTKIGRLHTSNSVTDEEGFIFLAQELTAGQTSWDDTEVLKIKKLPFTQVLDMVMSNEITDAITIIAVLKVARILGL